MGHHYSAWLSFISIRKTIVSTLFVLFFVTISGDNWASDVAEIKQASEWNAIKGWAAIIFGVIGAVLGSLGYIQSRKTKSVTNRIEADELLTEAFDLLGGKEGTHSINRSHTPTQEVAVKGRRLIDRAKILCPKYSRVYAVSATYLRVQGKLQKALDEVEYAIKLNPKEAYLHNKRANILKDSGRVNEALEGYKESIQLDSSFALAYANLGLLLRDRGFLEESMVSHEKSVELDEINADHHAKLGAVYMDLKMNANAHKSLERSIALNRNQSYFPHLLKGKLYLREENTSKAIECFNKCLEIDSGSSDAYCGLAFIYLNKGEASEFISYIEKALNVDPNNQWACTMLVNNIVETHDKDSLLEFLNEHFDKILNYGQIYASLADHYSNSGNSEAEIYFREKAVDCDSNNDQLHLSLAKTYLVRGLFDRATESIGNALELNDHSYSIYECSGDIEFQKGNYPRARLQYANANNLNTTPNGLVKIGICYEKENMIDEAVKVYRESLQNYPKHELALERLNLLEYQGTSASA